jgi:hypothetical protein
LKRHAISNAIALMLAAMVGVGSGLAAQSSSSTNTLSAQTRQMDTLGTSNQGAVSDRISSDFSTFAGSTQNSDALVSGLRNGTSVTLTATDAKGTTTSTTFTPPTGKMGYGNVYTSLALAKQNLAAAGITNPTPEQLQASLVGGTVTASNGQTTTMTGVLELRSQGMGWGQIAQQYGYKLGPVISGMRASNAALTAQSGHKPTVTTAITTTSGSGPSANTRSGIVTAAGGGNGHAYGRGIVTGAGAPGGGGQGYAHGQGIVTGAGITGGQGAGTAGAGHGKAIGRAN